MVRFDYFLLRDDWWLTNAGSNSVLGESKTVALPGIEAWRAVKRKLSPKLSQSREGKRKGRKNASGRSH